MSGTNTINWEGNVISSLYSGYGDDEIRGNASANLIIGNLGADASFGEGRNDEIYVNDGFGGDTVNCGEGTDKVGYDDPGDTIDLTTCENPMANP